MDDAERLPLPGGHLFCLLLKGHGTGSKIRNPGSSCPSHEPCTVGQTSLKAILEHDHILKNFLQPQECHLMKAVTALALLQGDIMGQVKDRQGASEPLVGRKVRC